MEFKDFILAHDGEDIAALALRRNALSGEVPDWDLALSTLQARSKLRHKVPEWYAIPSLQYPKALSAEQCSSTETANYKAYLVSGRCGARKTVPPTAHPPQKTSFSGTPVNIAQRDEGRSPEGFQSTIPATDVKIADLTGGLGVDAWAFSKVAEEVLYNEMDEGLCRAAEHNFSELGVGNVVIKNHIVEPGKVKEILGGFEPDMVFMDPARRGDGGRKVFRLEDCSPNVLELLPELYDACPNIMLKLSPMADITLVCKQLPGVREVHVVATGGECKELLLLLEKGYTGDYSTYIYDSGALLKIPDQVRNDVEWVRNDVEGGRNDEGSHCRQRQAILNEKPGWLFEPGKALLKAGAFDLPCEYGLTKLGRHTHLYVSQEPAPEEIAPFGKCFEILEALPLSGKTIKEVGKRYPKADVTARNIPITSEELAKRLGVKPGDGSLHIFGTQSDSEGKLLIIARATEREAPVPPRSSRTSA